MFSPSSALRHLTLSKIAGWSSLLYEISESFPLMETLVLGVKQAIMPPTHIILFPYSRTLMIGHSRTPGFLALYSSLHLPHIESLEIVADTLDSTNLSVAPFPSLKRLAINFARCPATVAVHVFLQNCPALEAFRFTHNLHLTQSSLPHTNLYEGLLVIFLLPGHRVPNLTYLELWYGDSGALQLLDTRPKLILHLPNRKHRQSHENLANIQRLQFKFLVQDEELRGDWANDVGMWYWE